MTENDLLGDVLGQCDRLGLFVLHVPDSRRILAGRGKGWPDLFIAGNHHVLMAELKSEDGKLSRDQIRWQYRLKAAGLRYVVWRPADLLSGAIPIELERLV